VAGITLWRFRQAKSADLPFQPIAKNQAKPIALSLSIRWLSEEANQSQCKPNYKGTLNARGLKMGGLLFMFPVFYVTGSICAGPCRRVARAQWVNQLERERNGDR
jgi:hypothetical protein